MGNNLAQWRAAIGRSSRARTLGNERKLNYPYGASDCDPDDVTKAINKHFYLKSIANIILPDDSVGRKNLFNALLSRLLLLLAGIESNPGPNPGNQEKPSYHHLSGSQKRKKAKLESLNSLRKDPKQQKLTFFIPPCSTDGETELLSPPPSDIPLSSLSVPLPPQLSPAPAPSPSSPASTSLFSHADTDTTSEGDSQTEEIVPVTSPSEEQNIEGDDFSLFSSSSSFLNDRQKEYLIMTHPIQPLTQPGCPVSLPFDPHRIYFQGPGEEKRLWLSYSQSRKKLYCWVCFGFAPKSETTFSKGWGNAAQWLAGRCYERVHKHENSKEHMTAINAYLAFSNRQSVDRIIDLSMKSVREQQIFARREVLLRIINIVLHLAKQGLAFRGSKSEAAYSLPLPCNHGNFLEEVKSRAKYDPVLNAYLQKVVEKSQARHEKHPSSQGRGSLVTFLSHSTFKKLLDITTSKVLDIIKRKILENGGKYSISLDGCQDISVKEILCLVGRYVDEYGPVEVLLDVHAASLTSGEALFEYVLSVLKNLGLSLENLVGYSFDGAGNMSGPVSGLQARLKQVAPTSVFQHCYAHVLNLVLQKSCNNLPQSEEYFNLLRDTATTISESYKRMGLWRLVSKCLTDDARQRCRFLVKFGKTRWWAKKKASDQIFVHETSILPIILTVLEIVSNDKDLSGALRAKIRGELRNWCNFETIAVGMLFHHIFSASGPVSDYLQGKQLDHVQAARMTANLIPSISAINLDEILDQAKILAEKCNEKLESLNSTPEFTARFAEVEVTLKTECERKRIPRVTQRFGEKSGDELRAAAALQSPNWLLKVNVLSPILSHCLHGLQARFGDQSDVLPIFKSCSFLSSTRFPEILKSGIPPGSLDQLCALANVDSSDVTGQLVVFAGCYDNLTKNIQADFRPNIDYSTFDVDFQENKDALDSEQDDVPLDSGDADDNEDTTCQGCLRCPYRVLRKHGLYTSAFKSLAKVYKISLTLPCTQVTCERCFSKLKIIKTRLRSMMSDDFLRSSMLLSVEREIVDTIDPVTILDQFAASSSELNRLLTV